MSPNKTSTVLLFFLGFLASLLSCQAYAQDEGAESSGGIPQIVGVIEEFEGSVVHHVGDNVRGSKVKSEGIEVRELDGLRAKSNSWAMVKLVDGSRVMLQEKSIIRFQAIKEVGVDAGKVLFDIKKQGGVSGMRVSTRTAVIGVKGTMFLVSQDEENTDVFLKEGLLDVDAKEGKQFKKYSAGKSPESAAEYANEFQQFKKQVNEEFSEYVRQIRMEAGMGITISNGNEVRDVKISPEMNLLFDRMSRYDNMGNRPRKDADKMSSAIDKIRPGAENRSEMVKKKRPGFPDYRQ